MAATDLEAMKAAFLAKGGSVTRAPEGIAYGVNAEADKVKRAEARAVREAEASERWAERQMERVREAYHVGGRSAALAALSGEA